MLARNLIRTVICSHDVSYCCGAFWPEEECEGGLTPARRLGGLAKRAALLPSVFLCEKKKARCVVRDAGAEDADVDRTGPKEEEGVVRSAVRGAGVGAPLDLVAQNRRVNGTRVPISAAPAQSGGGPCIL